MARRKKNKATQGTNMSNIFRRLKLISTNLFEWKGLPETINERFLEEILFEHGMALWFDMPGRGLFVQQAAIGGQLNMYGEATNFVVTSVDPDFHGQQRDMDSAVVMWNDYSRQPMRDIIMGFADRIDRIEKTIDINVNGQKTPYMIVGTDKQLLTLRNVFEDMDEYEVAIYIDKGMGDIENIIVHPTVAPYVADKLTDLKHDIWAEFYTFMGINNANTDKRERLNQTEVESNDPQIFVQKEVMLRTRQAACELINQMFGLSISVDYKEEVMEVNSNGEVHDTDQNDNSESE